MEPPLFIATANSPAAYDVERQADAVTPISSNASGARRRAGILSVATNGDDGDSGDEEAPPPTDVEESDANAAIQVGREANGDDNGAKTGPTRGGRERRDRRMRLASALLLLIGSASYLAAAVMMDFSLANEGGDVPPPPMWRGGATSGGRAEARLLRPYEEEGWRSKREARKFRVGGKTSPEDSYHDKYWNDSKQEIRDAHSILGQDEDARDDDGETDPSAEVKISRRHEPSEEQRELRTDDEKGDPIATPPASTDGPADDDAAHALVEELQGDALHWDELSEDEQAVLVALGYSELTWNRGAASRVEELSCDDDAEAAATASAAPEDESGEASDVEDELITVSDDED